MKLGPRGGAWCRRGGGWGPLKRRLGPMGSIMWERDVAEVYDQTYRAKFEPSVLDPVVDRLSCGPSPVLARSR